MLRLSVGSVLVLVLGLFTIQVRGQGNSPAQAKCRALHHVDAEPTSEYGNSQCLLKCMIHGRPTVHNLNEGLPCPLTALGTCRSGVCQFGPSAPSQPGFIPSVVTSNKLGFIDIEVKEAKLSEKVEPSYVNVCIQNATFPLTLPIQNRASCVSCTSNLAKNGRSKEPEFDFVCADSNKRLFVQDARVSFELWEHRGAGAANKQFLGGASMTIPQLLSHGDNHEKVKLGLTGGSASGTLKVRVTWTPK